MQDNLITADALISRWEDLFPGIIDISLPTAVWRKIPLADVKRIAEITKFERYPYLKPGMVCFAYTKLLSAYVYQEFWLDYIANRTPDGECYPPAVFQVSVDRMNGKNLNPHHQTALFVTPDAGEVWLEPQTDAVRPVVFGDDYAYRIDF